MSFSLSDEDNFAFIEMLLFPPSLREGMPQQEQSSLELRLYCP